MRFEFADWKLADICKMVHIQVPKYLCDVAHIVILWIIYVISVLFFYSFMHVCLLMPVVCWSPAEKGLTSWLSFVMSNYDVVTFSLVSWVRCGA